MLFANRTIWQYLIVTFVLLLPGIFPGRSNAKAAQGLQVALQVEQKANICGSDEFLLLIRSNEVYASDSLYGFTIDIRYNPDEITFNNVIWNNTLGNQTDDKKFDYDTYTSQPKAGIFIQAAKSIGSGYLKGNLPFVILKGKFRSKCTLRSTIYMTDFTALYEFGTIRDEPNFQLSTDSIALKSPNVNNVLTISANTEKIALTNKTNSDTISFVVQSKGIDLHTDSLNYFLQLSDTNNFKIDSCWIDANSELSEIHYNADGNITIKYKSANIDNINVTTHARITSKKIATKDTLKSLLYLTIRDLSTCSCVSAITKDSVQLTYYEIISSIDEEPDNLVIETPTLTKYTIQDWLRNSTSNLVTITSVLGQRYYYTNSESLLYIKDFPAGIYLITLDNSSVIAKYLQY